MCGDYLSRLPALPQHYEFLRNMPDACALATILSNTRDVALACTYWSLHGCRAQLLARSEIEAACAFWISYLNRLLEERAGFKGDTALGFGLIGTLRLAHWPHIPGHPNLELAANLVSVIERCTQLEGVVLGMQNFLNEYVTAGTGVVNESAGYEWRRCRTTNATTFSWGFGTISLPSEILVPVRLLRLLHRY